jgi:hypothetical protein
MTVNRSNNSGISSSSIPHYHSTSSYAYALSGGLIEAKYCATCGRLIEYRSSKNWQELKYCSKNCRLSKPNGFDKQLEREILRLLNMQKCIDIDDAAKAYANEPWSGLRERGRRAARRLVQEGKIEFIQQGRVLEPSHAKGAIELRKKL